MTERVIWSAYREKYGGGITLWSWGNNGWFGGDAGILYKTM